MKLKGQINSQYRSMSMVRLRQCLGHTSVTDIAVAAHTKPRSGRHRPRTWATELAGMCPANRPSHHCHSDLVRWPVRIAARRAPHATWLHLAGGTPSMRRLSLPNRLVTTSRTAAPSSAARLAFGCRVSTGAVSCPKPQGPQIVRAGESFRSQSTS